MKENTLPVKKYDNILIVHDDTGDVFEGWVYSVTDKYLTIQEKYTGIYRTFLREGIRSIEVN